MSAVTPEGSQAGQSERPTWIAFLFFVLLAGSNPVAIRYSNAELPPFWGATARLTVAAAVFWIIALVRRAALPKGQALLRTVLYGLVGTGAANALSYWALVRVQAGMAALFLALVPLMTLFLAAAHGQERLSWRGLVGGLIAVLGTVVIVGGGLGTSLTIPAVLALLGVVLCMGEGAVIFKAIPRGEPVATNAVSISASAVMLGAISLLAGETWRLPSAAHTWAAFAYLAIVGSVLVFYLYLYVLMRWSASRSAYGFVLLPVASVIVSALLTGEVVTTSFVIGAIITLLGVWLAALSRPTSVSTPRAAPSGNCASC